MAIDNKAFELAIESAASEHTNEQPEEPTSTEADDNSIPAKSTIEEAETQPSSHKKPRRIREIPGRLQEYMGIREKLWRLSKRRIRLQEIRERCHLYQSIPTSSSGWHFREMASIPVHSRITAGELAENCEAESQ
jgi:hypothetical protein